MKRFIYLDNAATSFPKPPQVTEAMTHYMREVGANPGRSGHRLSLEASRIVEHAREGLATLFHVTDPSRIAFTMNVTESLLKALYHVPGITIYGPLKAEDQTTTLSVTFDRILPIESDRAFGGCGSINLAWMEEGIPPPEAADILNSRYDIFVRVGLHCAPLAHQTLGTFPEGTVRISMGYFNTLQDMKDTAQAIRAISEPAP